MIDIRIMQTNMCTHGWINTMLLPQGTFNVIREAKR